MQTLLFVGGNGAMARFLRPRLEQAGYTVRAVDKPLEPSKLATALYGVDMVILAVPVPAMEEVLAQIAPLMPAEAVLTDICSVKDTPVRHMLHYFAGDVVGTHPLFGPNPAAETPLRTVVVPGRGDGALQAVRGVLECAGLECFASTAEAHDRSVALLQGLNFVTSVAYLACSADQETVGAFMTPSFHRRLEAARKMLLEDAPLFSALFEANPYSQDAVRQFRSYLNLAAAGDLDILVEKAAWWWRGATYPEESCDP
ncbi:MAG: prephenate dehydrogenase/arogenate dehydrogenase family protein [Desulfohalobium sp.]